MNGETATKAVPYHLKQLVYVRFLSLVLCGWNAGNLKGAASVCAMHMQTNGAGAWLGRRRPTNGPTEQEGRM